ncbi:MAG: hypothetical protein R3A51_12370 [Nannocystaceae bacterium]|nr:hypothetical protein [Myxococcales bacterium]
MILWRVGASLHALRRLYSPAALEVLAAVAEDDAIRARRRVARWLEREVTRSQAKGRPAQLVEVAPPALECFEALAAELAARAGGERVGVERVTMHHVRTAVGAGFHFVPEVGAPTTIHRLRTPYYLGARFEGPSDAVDAQLMFQVIARPEDAGWEPTLPEVERAAQAD